MSMATTLAQVVGNNVRNRRKAARISLDQLAAYSPLPMSTGRIGDIESGRAALTVSLLLAIAAALSFATMQAVTLADLFEGEGDVELGAQFDISLSTLRATFRGKPVPVMDAEADRKLGEVMNKGTRLAVTGLPEWKRLPQWARRNVDPNAWLQVAGTMRETDIRMCKMIGVDRELGAALMTKLWGRPFSAERDHRAEPDAKAQGRGQISRQLKAELQKAIR
jgi:transcriptional regulator with XRE-family HTH domain